MVVETSTADVLVNNDGIPEQVNEYRITELLGEGAFAKVFKAEKTIHDQLHYYVRFRSCFVLNINVGD